MRSRGFIKNESLSSNLKMKMEKDSIYSSIEKRKIHAAAPMDSSFPLITEQSPRRPLALWPLTFGPAQLARLWQRRLELLCLPRACPLGPSHLSWVSP